VTAHSAGAGTGAGARRPLAFQTNDDVRASGSFEGRRRLADDGVMMDCRPGGLAMMRRGRGRSSGIPDPIRLGIGTIGGTSEALVAIARNRAVGILDSFRAHMAGRQAADIAGRASHRAAHSGTMSATSAAATTRTTATAATARTTTGSERYGRYGQSNTGDGEKRPTFSFHLNPPDRVPALALCDFPSPNQCNVVTVCIRKQTGGRPRSARARRAAAAMRFRAVRQRREHSIQIAVQHRPHEPTASQQAAAHTRASSAARSRAGDIGSALNRTPVA